MTTYNTGNALGSSDARDLYDNAENIDNFANGAANTYQDRLGVIRKSMAGMENAFDAFIQSSGYTVPVAYTSGIVLSAYNQLIEYNDEFYKLKAGQAPYTTTGTWGTDSAKLVSVGDAALRQELTNNANDFNLLPEIGNYAELLEYTGDVTSYYVRGVANVFDGGHGVFRRTTETPSAANGIYRQDALGRWWKREFSGAAYLRWFGADGSGVAVSDDAISAALSYVQATGCHLSGHPGDTYKISQDFICTAKISVDFSGVTFVQTTDGKGFLQLRADGNSVKNVSVRFDGTRVYLAGTVRYRGYSAWQRMCAVWVESSGNYIENISAQNLNSTLCLRGPVERNPAGAGYTGADTDPSTAYFYSTLATKNVADDIRSLNQDFCVTGHQQEDLEIVSYYAQYMTQKQNEGDEVPSHAIYMTTPGTTKCKNVRIGSGYCRKSRYGTGHKFLYFDGLVIESLATNECSGTAQFVSCTGVNIDNVVSLNNCIRLDEADTPMTQARYGIYSTDSDITIGSFHLSAETGLDCGGISALGASNIHVNDIRAVTNRTGVTSPAASIVRSENTSIVTIGISRHKAGAETKHDLVAIGASTIRCGLAEINGSKLLAANTGTGSVYVGIDQQQITSFSRSTSLSGSGIYISEVFKSVESSLASVTTMYGTTTAGSHTYSQREFFVNRIGNLVTIFAKFLVSGAFGGTGDVRIGPLPYSVAGSGSSADAGTIVQSGANITLAAGEILTASALDGENFIRLQTMAGLTKTNLPHTALGSGARVEFVLQYRTTDA